MTYDHSNEARTWRLGNRYLILHNLIRSSLDFSNAEFKILIFIFDRTIGFKHLGESIPYNHFRFGVYNRNTGTLHSPGTGMCESTIKAALRKLVAKGIISRTSNRLPFGTIYRINTKWWRKDLPQSWDVFHPVDLYPNARDSNQPCLGWAPGENPPTKTNGITKEEDEGTEGAELRPRTQFRPKLKKKFVVRPLPKHIAAMRYHAGEADFR